VPNPAFELWKAQEQQVLSYLLTSISHDVLVQIAALPTTVTVWKHIEEAFASQSRAQAINTRMALVTTQKGTMTVTEYVTKMKSLTDDMTSAGKKLDDEEIASYILAGLDYEYNHVVSSIMARVDPISIGELYS
jgi:K+-sensing histidine kinase KdpD